MKIELIPYQLVDGIPTFRDSDIRGLFDRMVSDGSADLCCRYGENIDDAKTFLRAMKRSLLFVVYVDGEISGCIWLNGFEARWARCHWVLFSNQWGRDSEVIGRQVLQDIMNMKSEDGQYRWDVLIGFTPSANVRAVNYCRKSGGIILGEIPNVMWNKKTKESELGTIVYYVRGEEL